VSADADLQLFLSSALLGQHDRKPHYATYIPLRSPNMAPTLSGDASLFHTERISQYVSIPPLCLSDPFSAVCATVLSPLLLTYFPPANGVVLAYEDVDLSSTPPSAPAAKSRSKHAQHDSGLKDSHAEPLLLKHVDEYAAPFLWATASFLVWRPVRNAYLQAHITDQAKTHITLAHLNTFPVSILKEHMPADWSWHQNESGKVKKGWDDRLSDEGGWWVNGKGKKVEGELRVRIRDVDGRMDGKGKGKGFLRVDGSLLSQEEEKAAKAAQKGGRGSKKTTADVSRTQQRRDKTNGEVMEVDSESD
jgi:DNA-directed RNA polymerase I subunit RPA43